MKKCRRKKTRNHQTCTLILDSWNIYWTAIKSSTIAQTPIHEKKPPENVCIRIRMLVGVRVCVCQVWWADSFPFAFVRNSNFIVSFVSFVMFITFTWNSVLKHCHIWSWKCLIVCCAHTHAHSHTHTRTYGLMPIAFIFFVTLWGDDSM